MCVLKAAVSNPNSSIDTTKNIIKNQNLTEPEKGSEPDKPATGQALAKGDGSSVSKKGQAISSFSFGVEPYNDPKPIIDNIRNTKATNRDSSLIKFGSQVENMTKHELKDARDYLVNQMASPTNKDDQLLGAMLNKVNSESYNHIYI